MCRGAALHLLMTALEGGRGRGKEREHLQVRKRVHEQQQVVGKDTIRVAAEQGGQMLVTCLAAVCQSSEFKFLHLHFLLAQQLC